MIMNQLGYLRAEDEIPNSKKFAFKTKLKKLEQKDLTRRNLYIEEKGSRLPGIIETSVIQPKAKGLVSNQVRAFLRNGHAWAKPRAGFGAFMDMSNKKKAWLAAGLVAGAFFAHKNGLISF